MPLTGTVITVKAYGGDYSTLIDAYTYCLNETGNFIIEVDAGTWGDIELFQIDGEQDWPSRIAIRGAIGCTPDTCSMGSIAAYNGNYVTINSDNSIRIGSILGPYKFTLNNVTCNLISHETQDNGRLDITSCSIGTVHIGGGINGTCTDCTFEAIDFPPVYYQDINDYTLNFVNCRFTSDLNYFGNIVLANCICEGTVSTTDPGEVYSIPYDSSSIVATDSVIMGDVKTDNLANDAGRSGGSCSFTRCKVHGNVSCTSQSIEEAPFGAITAIDSELFGSATCSQLSLTYSNIPVENGTAILRPGDLFTLGFIGAQNSSFYGKNNVQFTKVRVPDVMGTGML